MSQRYADAIDRHAVRVVMERAGRGGEDFDAALEEYAGDLVVDDSLMAYARDAWQYGRAKSLTWTYTVGGQQAAAVTSGRMCVLLDLRNSSAPRVAMWEVVPATGRPFRLVGQFPNVNAAIDAHGLRRPQ